MFARKLKGLCLLSLFLISIFFVPPVGLQGNTSEIQNEALNEEDPIKTGSDQKISASVNYDPENGIYSWWDPNFTYRVPIEINSTFKNRTDYSVKLTLNFTEYLIQTGWSGTLDPESIRVIEYELDSGNNYIPVIVNSSEIGTNKNVVPSKFIPLSQSGYDASTNAIGQIWFQMNGKTLKNTNRTYMIYFDTIENTGDLTSIPSSLVWNKDYNWETDVMGDGDYHLAFGCYQYAASGVGKLIIYNEDLSQKIYESYPHASVSRYLDPVPGDFDGDGNVELVVFDHDRYLWIMDYNPVTSQMYDLISAPALPIDWDVNVLRAKFGSYDFAMRQLFAADYDNDGYTELIGITVNAGQQRIVVFNLTRSSSTWNMQVENFIDLLAGNPYHLNIADLNFDGYMDFIMANYSPGYNFAVYLYDGLSFTKYLGEATTYTGQGDKVPNDIFAISTGDIDNDGNIEIVITDYDNTIPTGKSFYFWQWNRATSELQFEQRALFNNTAFSNPTVGALYDYDYDGYNEILVGNYDATGNSSIDLIEVVGPEGTPIRFNEASEWGYGDTNVPYQLMLYPRFADINNDGKVELVAGSRRDYNATNYGAVVAWNQDSQTPIWTSEQVWLYAGTGAVGFYTMMNVFGSFDNYVYRMEPSSYIWKSKASAKNPSLEILVLDVDMGPVSNAKVTINKTTNDPITTNTNQNGFARFDLLLNGDYDIQVNYTNQLGEVIVGTDSATINSAEDLFVEKTIITNLWQVNFNVTDVDGIQYTKGKLNLYNSSKEDNIKAGILDLASQNKFTWLNRSEDPDEYNYTVTYENNLYNPAITDIVDSKVVKLNSIELGANFNETLLIPMGPPNDYQYVFDFNSGRDQFLNWVNISISNSIDYIYKIEVYLLIQSVEDLVTSVDISGTSTTDWTGNASLCIKNKAIRADSLRSNQIRIKVYGINSTTNDGIINITLFDEQREDITVPMSKKHIKLVDENQINANGVLVHIYNNPSLPGTGDDEDDKNFLKGLSPLVNLTTIDGIALDANYQPFYYLTKDGGASDGNYTITAEVMNDYQRLKWDDISTPFRSYQNYTLEIESQVQFQIQFSMDNWETEVYYLDPLDLTYDFTEDILLRVNVTANDTTDELPAISIPASLTLRIWSSKTNTQVFTTTSFVNEQLGVYSFTLNFEDLGISLPTNDYTYLLGIFASTPGYGSNPNPIYSTVTIDPITAALQIYRKVGVSLTEITGAKLNVHWGDKINVTMYYHSTTVDIANALVKLNWDFDNMVTVTADTDLGDGYYTYEIDSGKADNLGTYRINFYASQINYSSDYLKYIDLVILPIQTTLGGNYTLLGVNQQMADVSTLLNRRISINVTDAFNITFNYKDSSLNGVTGAETISYTWILYDSNNEVVDTNIETLYEIGDGRYDMDMNTENLQVGEYTIVLTIQKDKYEARQAAITLQIKERTFSVSPIGSFSSTYQIRQTKDNQFNLSISLVDLSRDMQPLLGATVSLDLGELGVISLTDDNNDGIYTHILDVSNLNAFIAPITLSGELTITLENYTTQTKSVTIVIKMDEIFAGFPMFYFIVIVGVVGSLVIGLGTYKYVQQARIPEFIKKCDATSKVIAKKKSLNASTPFVTTKHEFLLSELGDGWAALGLNVENALEESLKKGSNTSYSDSEEGI